MIWGVASILFFFDPMVYFQEIAPATLADARRAPVSGHGMAPAPAHSRSSRCAWRTRFGYVCSAFKYACCEPCSDDLYEDDEQSSDGHSDLDGVFDVKREHQEAPKPISSFESSQALARVVARDKHREDRERLLKRGAEESRRTTYEEEKEDVGDEIADSPSTDATRMASLTIEDFSVPNEEKVRRMHVCVCGRERERESNECGGWAMCAYIDRRAYH